MGHDVFISYSSKDSVIANAVLGTLEGGRYGEQIRCWIAYRDARAGEWWADDIINAINKAKIMVVILSGNCNRSRHVRSEVDRAVSQGVIIIPFRIEDVEPAGALAFYLAGLHWLDALTPPREKELEKLFKRVRANLEEQLTESVTPGSERVSDSASPSPELPLEPIAGRSSQLSEPVVKVPEQAAHPVPHQVQHVAEPDLEPKWLYQNRYFVAGILALVVAPNLYSYVRYVQNAYNEPGMFLDFMFDPTITSSGVMIVGIVIGGWIAFKKLRPESQPFAPAISILIGQWLFALPDGIGVFLGRDSLHLGYKLAFLSSLIALPVGMILLTRKRRLASIVLIAAYEIIYSVTIMANPFSRFDLRDSAHYLMPSIAAVAFLVFGYSVTNKEQHGQDKAQQAGG